MNTESRTRPIHVEDCAEFLAEAAGQTELPPDLLDRWIAGGVAVAVVARPVLGRWTWRAGNGCGFWRAAHAIDGSDPDDDLDPVSRILENWREMGAEVLRIYTEAEVWAGLLAEMPQAELEEHLQAMDRPADWAMSAEYRGLPAPKRMPRMPRTAEAAEAAEASAEDPAPARQCPDCGAAREVAELETLLAQVRTWTSVADLYRDATS